MSSSPSHQQGLLGKNALLTQAHAGWPWQVAQALGEAGARLMLCAREPDALERACARLQDEGLDGRWVAADLDTRSGVDHVVAETRQRMGEIDVLVDSSTALPASSDAPAPMEGLQALSLAVVQHSMAHHQAGCIVHLVWPASQVASTGDVMAEHALCQALQSLCRSQAQAWAHLGITVNGVQICSGQVSDSLQALTVLLASSAGRHISGQCWALGGMPAQVRPA